MLLNECSQLFVNEFRIEMVERRPPHVHFYFLDDARGSVLLGRIAAAVTKRQRLVIAVVGAPPARYIHNAGIDKISFWFADVALGVAPLPDDATTGTAWEHL